MSCGWVGTVVCVGVGSVGVVFVGGIGAGVVSVGFVGSGFVGFGVVIPGFGAGVVSSSKSENSTCASPGCRVSAVATGCVVGVVPPDSEGATFCLQQPVRAASKQTAKIILIQIFIDHFLIVRKPYPAP